MGRALLVILEEKSTVKLLFQGLFEDRLEGAKGLPLAEPDVGGEVGLLVLGFSTDVVEPVARVDGVVLEVHRLI
jgi:hypothetical protein